jgi:anti-sigma B factor antagonist
MGIHKKHTNDTLELMMPGRVDGEAANDLEVEVIAAMREGVQAIYVNLAESTFLCSAGIRVLLQYHRKMKSQDGVLQVSHAAPQVVAALELAGFPEIIEK